MSYVFRRMVMADIVEVLTLEQAYFEDTYTYHNELLTYALNQDLSFVCIWHGDVVGFVKSEILASDCRASICVLCVSLQHRRQGIARRLVQLAVEAVKSKGSYGSIELFVSGNNWAAINLYKSLGFVIIQEVPRLYANSFPAYRMALNISGGVE